MESAENVWGGLEPADIRLRWGTSTTMLRFQLSVVVFSRFYVQLVSKKDADVKLSLRPPSMEARPSLYLDDLNGRKDPFISYE